MLDNQLVLLIHRQLYVVAHLAALSHRHAPAVGVGQRDLLVAALLELLLVALVALLPLLPALQFLLKLVGLSCLEARFFPVLTVQLLQIGFDLGVDFRDPFLEPLAD